ncbi:MAG: S-layer protein [Paenibacillus sp.]|nr:S-layer protein [Paenibacillus sp.]
MAKRWASILVALLLIVALQSNVFAFSDIKGDAAEADIVSLRDAGIVSGISAELFAPKGKVTYAQGVHMIVKGFNLNIDHIRFIKEPKASDYYKNVQDDSWYAPSFIIAQFNGLSVPQDVDPQSVMTREQYSKLLWEGISQKGDFPMIEIWIQIADENEISQDAMSSIQNLLIAKIANLDNGKFFPKKEITRGESAQMLHKAIQFVKDHKPVPPVDPPINKDVTMEINKVTEAVNKVTVSWGTKPNPGYGINVDRIEFHPNGEAWIYYSTHFPDPDKMYPQVIVEPKFDTYMGSEYKPILKPMNSTTDISQ